MWMYNDNEISHPDDNRDWTRCVAKLHPDDRRLLERGGIDPSRPVRVRDDECMPNANRPSDSEDEGDEGDPEEDAELREMHDDPQHPGRFSHAAPLCFLQVYAGLLKQFRPPLEHPFHRLWKRQRQQEMGLLPPPAAADSQSSQDSDDEEAMQPQQKKPRLAAQQAEASSSDYDSDSEVADDFSGGDDYGGQDSPSQASHVVYELLHQFRVRHPGAGWMAWGGKPQPLSPEEQRELAPLIPGGLELGEKELTQKVQDSKTQLILELVLEDRVRTLLEFGADPNPEPAKPAVHTSTSFSLPLMAKSCPTSVVRLLLEGKADPNWSLLQGEQSALLVHRDNPEIVRLLLEAGANPDHGKLSGRAKSLADPAEDPIFLRFVDNGAPAESFRALLEHNPEIACQSRLWDGTERIKTPISEFVSSYTYLPHVEDVVLSIPYPIPEQCYNCATAYISCWKRAVGSKHWRKYLPALVRMGYPTRGLLPDIIEEARHDSEDMQAERLGILEPVTEEGQAQRRQEYLGGFWSAVMKAVPSLSGVVASLVLQTIVPEFQLRIA